MNARARIHAMLPILDSPAEADAREKELDRLLNSVTNELTGPPSTQPLIVSRFDVAIEPAPDEEQVLTIGAIAEDGSPVALLLDEETRVKVARWLSPGEKP